MFKFILLAIIKPNISLIYRKYTLVSMSLLLLIISKQH